MEDRLAWRKGMIVINDESLDFVISEFQNHSQKKILLADKKMAEIRVAGLLPIGRCRRAISRARAELWNRISLLSTGRYLCFEPAIEK